MTTTRGLQLIHPANRQRVRMLLTILVEGLYSVGGICAGSVLCRET